MMTKSIPCTFEPGEDFAVSPVVNPPRIALANASCDGQSIELHLVENDTPRVLNT